MLENFTRTDLLIKGKKILVIGDVIKDTYYSGPSDRISPEAPVPIVKIQNGSYRLGGAGNVAKNTKALDIETHVLTLTGYDSNSKDLEKALKQEKIKSFFVRNKSYKTPEKVRILSQNQQLIRLDFENDYENAMELKKSSQQLLEKYQELLKKHKYELVLISDYKKGTLFDCQKFIKIANRFKIPTIVDPKGSNFDIYQGTDILKPNLQEFYNVVGVVQSDSTILERALWLIKRLKIKKGIVLTKGAKGISYIGKNGEFFTTPVSSSREVFDVTGAGDTVLAALAGWFSGRNVFDYKNCLEFASISAGISVSKIGTYAPVVSEIFQEMNIPEQKKNFHILETNKVKKLLSKNILLSKIKEYREQSKTIVFTNGCFDVIHAGHVKLLKSAKAYGDLLIVGLNDDKSIATLKGENRPYHSMRDRINVLEQMECVDHIVAFSATTPLELIKTIKPNVLIKGGEYQLKNIIGSSFVKSYGGDVKTIKMHKKLSSTDASTYL